MLVNPYMLRQIGWVLLSYAGCVELRQFWDLTSFAWSKFEKLFWLSCDTLDMGWVKKSKELTLLGSSANVAQPTNEDRQGIFDIF